MSSHKQKGEATVATGTIIGKDRSRWGRLISKPIIPMAVGVLVIGVVVFGVVRYHYAHKPVALDHPPLVTAVANKPIVQDPEQQASSQISNGDYAGAIKTLDNYRKTTTDKTQKFNAYILQSLFATDYKKYDDAKAYAQEAQKLNPNASDLYNAFATLAQAHGDKATAKANWQQAIDHLDKSNARYDSGVRQFQQDIAGLQT